MDQATLATAVDRAPVNDDGRSGATLERVRLADGRTVVVKRFDPDADIVMQISGDRRGREVGFFLDGLFDHLPPTVGHPILGAWYGEDDRGVLVMRDLGDRVFTCQHRLDHVLELQREAAGPAYDDGALRLGLLAGLVWLGWNKALDIVEHPDEAVRERERTNLRWWLHQAELAFESELV